MARAALPPLLGLPVDVGLGKTSSARVAIAELIAAGGLGPRKVVCAHDSLFHNSLFHMKPQVIGEVGLLVIDEAFWQSGLRGLDGKATLTQDGLEPGRNSLTCYTGKGKMDVGATADLIAARERLCKALRVTEPGPLRLGLLEAVGLTPEDCRHAATLERRRMRDAGLRPGISPVERRKRIEAVLPPAGEPWAPPGRCAALRLRWRSRMRTGWASQAPILHLDATLRPELVQTYLPRIDIAAPGWRPRNPPPCGDPLTPNPQRR